jgi:hypothetical protein
MRAWPEFVFLQATFEEGLTFVGDDFISLNELLHLVSGTVYRRLLIEAQTHPNDFNIRKDYLDVRSDSPSIPRQNPRRTER